MPRWINPTGWELVKPHGQRSDDEARPLVELVNSDGHSFSIHPVSSRLVRVAHQFPSRPHGIRLRQIKWERPSQDGWQVQDSDEKRLTLISPEKLRTGAGLRIVVDWSVYVRLEWYWDSKEEHTDPSTPFFADFKRAYPYDAVSGRICHYVEGHSYMPMDEDQQAGQPPKDSNLFIYGLGETRGGLNKLGQRFLLDGRDALAADPTVTDPLYKLYPFYLRHDASRKHWMGIYYDTLNPCIFDFGAEHDFSTGNYHYFTSEHGPLDYYLLLGDDDNGRLPGTASSGSVSSIVSQFARLVTPPTESNHWRSSAVLPPLSQFGYLASSLTLSERSDAQQAVVDYGTTTRTNGFPIDGMHLSSGYCQDKITGERHYFQWNLTRYPDSKKMGQMLEIDLKCQVIVNVKPWLLQSHPRYEEMAQRGVFVKAAVSTIGSEASSAYHRGSHGQSLTHHWSSSMGQTALGSYFDFTSLAGVEAWSELIKAGVLANDMTGLWIDNNEYSTLIDDADEFANEVDVLPSSVHSRSNGDKANLSVPAGQYGRALQTLAMARCTFSTLLSSRPHHRPVIITRSAVPGIQTYTTATWSGDNSTTWSSLRYSTKMTLSYGLSFGIGLYGHDIGGFAGPHSPSSELLIRWCQQSLWHSRFTLHSWKKISTTLWMYDDLPEVGKILREIVRFRYRLIPMLYSLYVEDYWKKGWPVLRPLFWHHWIDRCTLDQDEQFLFGSHVLVEPVVQKGARSITFHLPEVVLDDVTGRAEPCWWYNPFSHQWIAPGPQGISSEAISPRLITLGAPLDRCPYLLRGGAIFVVSCPDSEEEFKTVFDPPSSRRRRLVTLYPPPDPTPSHGSFTLVEDDGWSNEATMGESTSSPDGDLGKRTEIVISYHCNDKAKDENAGETSQSRTLVYCRVDLQRATYPGEWDLEIRLSQGDERRLCLVGGEGTDDEANDISQSRREPRVQSQTTSDGALLVTVSTSPP